MHLKKIDNIIGVEELRVCVCPAGGSKEYLMTVDLICFTSSICHMLDNIQKYYRNHDFCSFSLIFFTIHCRMPVELYLYYLSKKSCPIFILHLILWHTIYRLSYSYKVLLWLDLYKFGINVGICVFMFMYEYQCLWLCVYQLEVVYVYVNVCISVYIDMHIIHRICMFMLMIKNQKKST